jgi:hypothetical protein
MKASASATSAIAAVLKSECIRLLSSGYICVCLQANVFIKKEGRMPKESFYKGDPEKKTKDR